LVASLGPGSDCRTPFPHPSSRPMRGFPPIMARPRGHYTARTTPIVRPCLPSPLRIARTPARVSPVDGTGALVFLSTALSQSLNVSIC
jgi:hypothetical protein